MPSGGAALAALIRDNAPLCAAALMSRRFPMSNLMRRVRGFARLARFEQLHFVAAWVLLGLARLAIVAVSFRRLAPCLGASCGTGAWIPVLDTAAERRAGRIGRAVRLAARHTPWESNCFPQAVTARLLLGMHGIPYALYFGLARDAARPGTQLKAHAWVAAGRVCVTGGRSFGEYAVVGCFAAPMPRA